MNRPLHLMNTGGGLSPERMVGIGFVALLHVIALWALISGLAIKFFHIPPHEIEARVLVTPDKLQQNIDLPKPVLAMPPQASDAVTPPVVTFLPDAPPTVTRPETQPTPTPTAAIPDTAAAGITNTHTTPPYPPIARKLGQQGSVRLRLTISASGLVTAADVVQSSGIPELDQSAVAWVIAHWKYKPAVQNAVAMPSTAQAQVVFNIKNAR